jgi:hypothetical protein
MAGGTLMSRLVSHAAFFCLFFFSPQNILVREPEANTKKKKKKPRFWWGTTRGVCPEIKGTPPLSAKGQKTQQPGKCSVAMPAFLLVLFIYF